MHALLFLTAILLSVPTHAVTVYRSVDAAGRISFSDQPPAEAVSTQEIELRSSAPAVDEDLQARLQAMRETTERLREDRLARARMRQPQESWTPPAMPTGDAQRNESHDVGWLLPYRRPHHGWHSPPPRPYPQPPLRPATQPNSSSLSPRGLQQRLLDAR